MRFEFATATRIVFGPGTVAQAAALAGEMGRRALVVTGRNSGRAAGLIRALENGGAAVQTVSITGEPDIPTIEDAVGRARRADCDFVISLGGGSVLDAGKAIGRGRMLAKPSVPFIAIPTTAGTGAEVTRNAVLASPKDRLKVSLRSPFMLPTVAVVDPDLAFELPPALSASTGLDALTQLIEPYVCSRANPMADALCREGITRAARSLRTVCVDSRNAAAREDMALASLFGGLALANAGLGAVHGLAGPIGGMFPAPHGAVCAALLPGVMAANLKALRSRGPGGDTPARYETVAQWLTGRESATADEGVAWVRQLVADLGIPPLGTYGIGRGQLVEIAAAAQNASSMKANPVALTLDELCEITAGALA
jgi:alcohol dehydrogenase class IV